MSALVEIIAARAEHVAALPAIEAAAGRLFVGWAPESVLEDSTGLDELTEAQQAGRLWVALAVDRPDGFALVERLGPRAAHLEEIDVHPDHGRRGIGRRLVAAVCAWAASEGCTEVTLTTFRDVPWNAPFYASCGFEPIEPAKLPANLAEIVREESTRGLDPARRVVMRFRVGGS